MATIRPLLRDLAIFGYSANAIAPTGCSRYSSQKFPPLQSWSSLTGNDFWSEEDTHSAVADMDILPKHRIEAQLHDEHTQITQGRLKDESPLDVSDEFHQLCEACRKGDLKVCQEMITEGANINARDSFDYTPLILASLCGHYEVVQLLLEAGALCERDTFQGERCLYNALNDRIRNLLLQYDYSKSTDPLQPLSSHVTSLLSRGHPQTSDITLVTGRESFYLHKFILSARSPYFQKKLASAPETTSWKISNSVPTRSFDVVVQFLYLGELPLDLGGGEREKEILTGVDKVSKQLEISGLFENLLEGVDKRIFRQRRQEEVERGQKQLEDWFRHNVLKYKVTIDADKAEGVRWDRENAIFADVLIRADESVEDDLANDDTTDNGTAPSSKRETLGNSIGIPVGHAQSSRSPSRSRSPRKSILFPVHRAMLIRSEYFLTMFSSEFKEAQLTPHLQIIPMDCSPAVAEAVLTFLYTEKADFGLDIAIDVLMLADQFFIEKLKTKAAVVISTLGNGPIDARDSSVATNGMPTPAEFPSMPPSPYADETLDIYEVIRAGWLTHVRRLEEFGARYLAYRLEYYIDEEEFAELIKESASRIQQRQETDSIELLDDIRYYLSDRFRLRFEDAGLEEMLDEDAAAEEAQRQAAQEYALGHEPKQGEALTASAAEPTASFEPKARTLDGELAGDEFDKDAYQYSLLLGKIDTLLEKLKLDA